MKKRTVEQAILDAFKAVGPGRKKFYSEDIETPWDFTPPVLYPTVHVYARRDGDEAIVIKIAESL